MAKKKKAVRPGEKGKVRLDIRFDDDVHAGLTRLADEAGVSINRIVNALGLWAAKAGKVPRPWQIDFAGDDGKRFLNIDFRDTLSYRDG
ncbi:MAG TPA: hypothetical protein VMV69_08860 [Pirellulales bacterium]|nr:hypothetical protein [Pirellulales bacterium]